jgi:hypothetical protein
LSLFAGSPSRGAAVTDPNDLDKDRGPADFDARHRFTFAGTWALPLARRTACSAVVRARASSVPRSCAR